MTRLKKETFRVRGRVVDLVTLSMVGFNHPTMMVTTLFRIWVITYLYKVKIWEVCLPCAIIHFQELVTYVSILCIVSY